MILIFSSNDYNGTYDRIMFTVNRTSSKYLFQDFKKQIEKN